MTRLVRLLDEHVVADIEDVLGLREPVDEEERPDAGWFQIFKRDPEPFPICSDQK